MAIANFTVTKKLDYQVNQIVKGQGFNSKAEFYRFAIFNYLNNIYHGQDSSNDNFQDAMIELSMAIAKGLKGKKLPSLEKQLSNI